MFAFPGDLVGLGFLEHHTGLASAVGDVATECLPRDRQEKLAAMNQSNREQLDAATEKEFEHQRVRLMGAAAQFHCTPRCIPSCPVDHKHARGHGP